MLRNIEKKRKKIIESIIGECFHENSDSGFSSCEIVRGKGTKYPKKKTVLEIEFNFLKSRINYSRYSKTARLNHNEHICLHNVL